MDDSLTKTIEQQTTKGPVRWLISRQSFWVLLAAIVGVLMLTLLTDTFATPQNLFNVTRNFAFVGIIAVGMTAVIITAGIDLSVGSIVVFTGIVLGLTMASGQSFWVALVLALGAALAAGFVNGALIAFMGMPPFVVTLGMLSVARSLAQVMSNNRLVFEFGPDQDLLLALGGGAVHGIPNPVIALVIVAAIAGFLFKWTAWGRYVFAIGGNEQAANLTGVPVKWIKVSVYMFSALTAGISSIFIVGWLGSVTLGLGMAMELQVIAAAVIGGANLAGGVGTAFGAVVGAALIEIIRNSLILLGIGTFWQGAFVGTFIVLAVMVDRIRDRQTA